MFLCPRAQCSGVSKARSGYPNHQGLPVGVLLTPGMPLGWITLSTEQTGLIQSFCPDPNLQDPGQPPRPLPTSRAPHVTSSATIAPAPFVQGKGTVSLTSPWPTFWASPRDGSLWPTPRPSRCHLSHLLPTALQRRAVDARATTLTVHSFPALLPQTQVGVRRQRIG